MKLAAIDIGTNSIHMVIAEAVNEYSFQVIDREKEMVKLGKGVFASNCLSERAFRQGLETLRRYVQLADQRGCDAILTAATSAIREAQNGSEFLGELEQQTGISPEIISGEREARLIFKAVRHEVALKGEKAMVIDIGGGSTELVVGDEKEIFLARSVKLGVQRLLDMFSGKESVSAEALGVLEAHIRFVAGQIIEKAREIGFNRIIGTSGTIRTLGHAAHKLAGGKSMRSVNAEIISLKDLQELTHQLIGMSADKRAAMDGIGERRADTIHLGGVLFTQLVRMAGVEEVTLCDASLREGLIIDYLETHGRQISNFPVYDDLRHRSVAQLAHQFKVDWHQATHVAKLALQLFDQTQHIHRYESYERDILEFAALLHTSGQYIRYKKYNKHSRYIISHAGLRGFNDEEVLLIGHVARYQRKSTPKKKHKKFKKLSKNQRRQVKVLAGILRIAAGLNRTKNQLVSDVKCKTKEGVLSIRPQGRTESMQLELWATRNRLQPLAEALDYEVKLKIPAESRLSEKMKKEKAEAV